MYHQEQLFLKVKGIEQCQPATLWKITSVSLFLLLLLPIFKGFLPYVYPLLYINDYHILSEWSKLLSFVILILMINVGMWLFYIGKLFIYQFLLSNRKLFKILFTVGFVYYLMFLLMSVIRLFQVAYSII